MAIESFGGEYHFLSNFSASPVFYEGLWYPTVEHAYQAAKTTDQETRAFIRTLASPGKAKRAGRMVDLRLGWNDMRLAVMEELLRLKFADLVLRAKLVATRPHLLVEGNWWKDTFFGVCNGVGENWLGKLLMKIRDEL